jgi:hypothetical protein
VVWAIAKAVAKAHFAENMYVSKEIHLCAQALSRRSGNGIKTLRNVN